MPWSLRTYPCVILLPGAPWVFPLWFMSQLTVALALPGHADWVNLPLLLLLPA